MILEAISLECLKFEALKCVVFSLHLYMPRFLIQNIEWAKDLQICNLVVIFT